MKKTLFTLILSFTTIICFSQTIDYGIKGGVNFSEESTNNAFLQSIPSKYLTGFNIGGVVEFGFQKFSIQPGIFFTTKGESIPVTVANQNGQNLGSNAVAVKSNYLELPVNFLYRLRISPLLSAHLGAGPYIAYEFSSSESGEPYSGSAQAPVFESDYNKPDYGLNFDAGVKINNKFIIDADYGLGLANIATPGTIKNRTLSFSIGYMIR